MCRWDVFAIVIAENVGQILIKIKSTREIIINESMYVSPGVLATCNMNVCFFDSHLQQFNFTLWKYFKQMYSVQ